MYIEDYINEKCSICTKDFDNISEVYVDIDTDEYVCLECAIKHNIQVNEAMDLAFKEEL